MTNNNDTIDYDSRADICGHVDKVRGQLEMIHSLLYHNSDLSAEGLTTYLNMLNLNYTQYTRLLGATRIPTLCLLHPLQLLKFTRRLASIL